MLRNKEVIVAPGVYDCVAAKIAESVGFQAVYMSGFGTSASIYGKPDVGLVTGTEMISHARNLTASVNVPVLADADTGYGNPINVRRTVQEYERAGVAGIHIEDQTFPKRCGVLAGKQVIPEADFAKKIRAAIDARRSEEFLIIARTDAKTTSGVDGVIERLNLYVENGADMAMLGDFYSLEEYERIVKSVNAPIVAVASCHGLFSRQPDISVDDWKTVGVKMVVYWHLTLFAAMKAVTKVVRIFKESGTTDQMKDDLCTYSEYADVLQLSKWLAIDEKYG